VAVGTSVVGWMDGKHYLNASERALRVAKALALCIQELVVLWGYLDRVLTVTRDSYRHTLKQLEGDSEDKDELLSKCHRRCAERLVRRKCGCVMGYWC
jgi:aarF domain-containing kinase